MLPAAPFPTDVLDTFSSVPWSPSISMSVSPCCFYHLELTQNFFNKRLLLHLSKAFIAREINTQFLCDHKFLTFPVLHPSTCTEVHTNEKVKIIVNYRAIFGGKIKAEIPVQLTNMTVTLKLIENRDNCMKIATKPFGSVLSSDTLNGATLV